jgi:RNA-splicing ligase RtcB
MLHSGSRRICKETAGYYNKIGMAQMKKQGLAKYPSPNDLNYLRIYSEGGQAYLNDME